MATGTIKLLEQRVVMMEVKEKLTKGDMQSTLRMSKLLSDMSNDFKTNYFAIVDQLDNEEQVETEQATLDEHKLMVMELIGLIGELVGKPFQSKTDLDNNLLRGRIKCVEKLYSIIKGEMEARGCKMDAYALRGQEERIKNSETEIR